MKLEGQKGNKKDIVWTREITDVDYYTASQYKHIARLKFGDWKFKAVYPSPKKIVEKTGVVNYKTNSTVGLLGAGNDVLLRYDSIRVEGRLPGKLPFIIHFNYLADVFEKDVSVGLTMLLKMDHTYEFGYFNYKAMDGFVVDPSGDLLPFHLMLYYSDSVVQPISYIQTGTDSIILKPVFDSKMSTSKKFRVSGSSYEGFNCYINEKLVGSAIWNQSMTGAHYKFWYDHKLDQKHQEAIASMMFIIVGIVN
jgi:hypothetical protein